MRMSDFPIPFTGRLELKGGDLAAHPSFVVASMYSPSHRDLATRLATSLEQLGLPFAIYEVPAVHRSISPRGNDDLVFTKANFISFVLDEYRTPILYVDCDCVFRAPPKRIAVLVADGCDFAVYNWLADEHTDAFLPCNVSTSAVPVGSNRPRFYRFSHSVDAFAPDQLICSGAVQFYSTNAAAHDLLEAWSNAVRDFPGVSDDECLDYAFNFRRSMTQRARSSWLDKSYARYMYWIYARPVIDHPQLPTIGDPTHPTIKAAYGISRAKFEHAEIRADGRLFPRDAVIDVEQRLILRPRATGRADGGMELVTYAPLHNELFLP
jgi:hypothetical protein